MGNGDLRRLDRGLLGVKSSGPRQQLVSDHHQVGDANVPVRPVDAGTVTEVRATQREDLPVPNERISQ